MKARDQLRFDTLRSALSGFTYKRSESGSGALRCRRARRAAPFGQATRRFADGVRKGRSRRSGRERTRRTRDLAGVSSAAEVSETEIREIVQSVLAELPPDNRNAGRGHESRHAAAQRGGRRQPRAPGRHRGTLRVTLHAGAGSKRHEAIETAPAVGCRCSFAALPGAAFGAAASDRPDRGRADHGTVDDGMAHLVERSVAEANATNAQAIVLEINSPGGLVASAFRIRDALFSANEPVDCLRLRTRLFGCSAHRVVGQSHIVMAPGASIGRPNRTRRRRRPAIRSFRRCARSLSPPRSAITTTRRSPARWSTRT